MNKRSCLCVTIWNGCLKTREWTNGLANFAEGFCNSRNKYHPTAKKEAVTSNQRSHGCMWIIFSIGPNFKSAAFSGHSFSLPPRLIPIIVPFFWGFLKRLFPRQINKISSTHFSRSVTREPVKGMGRHVCFSAVPFPFHYLHNEQVLLHLVTI